MLVSYQNSHILGAIMLYRSGGAYKTVQESFYEDMIATEKAKKVSTASVKFPDSESYVEKLLLIYFKGSGKPLEIYCTNYTEVYKKCVKLGITNKPYFRFMAAITDMCSIQKKGQLETVTFRNVVLADDKYPETVQKLPIGI